jgi:protein-S-isoprenylcysteine O-methyltransferase Ste14
MLTCVAVSILMPPIGSVFFLVGCGLLTAALVAAEGPHLQQQLGAAYAAYRKQIPAFIPAIRPHVASSEVKPEVKQHWAQAFAAESFHVGFAVCLAIFGWEYNVDLLIRCLLICFGVALVANGIFSSRGMRPATEPPV